MAVAVSEVISLANSILVHVGLPRKVSTLKQCNSSFFSQLYETLTGCRVPSLSLQAPTSEAVKCQAVIDALNVRLHPHVTLDHIQGTDIAQLDVISIKNLLDIFSVLFYVPLPTENGYGDVDSYSVDSCEDALVDDDGANVHVSDEANDSNVISTEGMSVISEVLREELGHSSRSTVTDSTTELVRPVPLARLSTRGNKTTKYATQVHSQQREVSSMGIPSTESSATTTTTCNSQPPSLTISSLHSTSTEESRVISQVQDAPVPVPNAGVSTAASARLHAQERTAETGSTNVNVGTVIPSGESSIGTTPSPTLHELHTPPQSPLQQGHHRHQQLSPLHHSTPHTSTRSRLFPASTSTSTAISSNLPPHPLGAGSTAAAVTPSVTTAHHQTRIQISARSTSEGTTNNIQRSSADQSTLTSITTADGESTLVPDSPPPLPSSHPPHPGPGPGHSATHARSRPTVPDLTITDLHTTTMSSSGGEGTAEPPPLDSHHRFIHVDAHGSSSEDSDSSSSSTSRSSANTETPPPELRHSTVQPVRTPRAISSKSTTDNTATCSAAAAQKVRFSHSIERRELERARHGGRNLTRAGQSGIEVGGDIPSAQLKLGLDAHAAGSRASVLATLYQNYLREVNTAQPVAKEAPRVASSESKKTRRTTESKLSRSRSKVVSSKYRELESSRGKHSKPAIPGRGPKPPLPSHTQERRASEGSSSGEESGSEIEQQRPPTPTEFAVGDNMFPLIEREFPFIYVSPSTIRRLQQKQLQQVTALTRPKIGQKPSTVKKMAEVEQKQKALLQIIKKELDHTKRLQRQFEEQREKVAVKSSIRAKRQATARAKRYYHDYELQLKAKLQRRRTREEQIFKRTFEEGLELQRERIKELKRYAKERQEQHTKIHQDQLDSMENYYRDQLAMLSESMMKERKECAIRGKAQNQMVQKMKRELRQKIESEIRELQECLINEEDVAHFRELDAQNVRHKLSRMTFTTTVK